MKLQDWFDPYNIDHIKAYDHLQKTGTWPEGFVSAGIEYSYLAIPAIQASISYAWTQKALNGHILGIPTHE